MIATEFPPILGGGGRYVENLIKGLSEQDVQILLLTSGEEDEEYSINKNLKIKRYKLFRNIYFGQGNFIEGVNQIIKEMKVYKPDIIHSHHSTESLMVQAANINFSIPHIITHHKTPEYRESMYLLNGKWSVFKFTNRADSNSLFVAPSKAFVKSLIDSGVDEENIFQIYPGLDQTIYKKIDDVKKLEEMRNKLDIDRKDVLILLPTQIRQRKGVEFALQSLSHVVVEGKKINVLVTGLPFLEIKRQKELVEKLLPNRLLTINETFKDEEMPILYNTADLVLLTSEAEGLGTCLLEAMACETSVIGTDVIGINEVITDSFNGRLVKFGDCELLAKEVINILSDKSMKQSLIKNGLTVLSEKFNLELQAKEHIKIYKNLFSNKLTVDQILKTEDILKVLNSLQSYKEIIEDETTIAFILIGSIPDKKYIPGWSDIDLICLVDKPHLEFFTKISVLERAINKITGVKTGIEVVNYENIKSATQNSKLAENFVKYMKNFYQKIDNEKVLFLRKDMELPFFNKKVVSNTSLVVHTLQTLALMNKFMKDRKTFENRKDSLRKIVKNILFLMQSYLLIKDNLFEDDYEEVIKTYCKSYPKLNCEMLSKYFTNRYIWKDTKDANINKDQIDNLWSLFQFVARENILASN